MNDAEHVPMHLMSRRDACRDMRSATSRCAISASDLGERSYDLDAPGDERLCDPTVLDRVADEVLLGAAHLAEEDHHLNVRVRLVADDVVPERRARVAVAADRNALVYAVRVLRRAREV